MPVGHLMAPEAPASDFQAGLTADRYDVKMNVVPLPSLRCTTRIGVDGIRTPWFSATIFGSFHFVIFPR